MNLIQQNGNHKRNILTISVFLFTLFWLIPVQLFVERPMLLLERFVPNGGWIELIIIALYGSFVAWKMFDPKNVPTWRKYTWGLFTAVFFGQLLLGILGFEQFLMTGKLHLPVPAVILGGPIFRFETGFMTILFLITIIMSGPAWCSHLCYFGALDNLRATGKARKGEIKNRTALKFSFLALTIFGALAMRFFGASNETAAIIGGSFGIIGILIIFIFSKRHGKMVHCTTYCPIGTSINYLRFINPFRMYIDNSCTLCNACTKTCRYDALDLANIKLKTPGITCTLCGDCVTSCHSSAIKYKFFRLSPENARLLYLFVTISLHAVFMALARL